MTQPGGRRARLLALATATCAAAIALNPASTQSAAAASCVITGGDVQATDPVHVGDPVRADARVTGACTGRTITFEGGGHTLGSGSMSTYKSYYTEFAAFAGLSTVTASVTGGNSMILGTVNVVGSSPTPTPPASTPVASKTPLPPPPTSAGASSSAGTSTSASASKTATRSLTPHTAAFPAAAGDPATSATDTPQPSASASPSSSEVALPVQVIHGSGGVNLIPSGLLIATIVVLGAIAGAAVHFVRAYSRSPDHLT